MALAVSRAYAIANLMPVCSRELQTKQVAQQKRIEGESEMVTIQTNMQWDKTALAKYNKMLNLIPVFHRRLAQEVVNKKAEQNAQARGSVQVEEMDIVRAFFAEVPKAFSSLMVRIMDEVGFDYKKYI